MSGDSVSATLDELAASVAAWAPPAPSSTRSLDAGDEQLRASLRDLEALQERDMEARAQLLAERRLAEEDCAFLLLYNCSINISVQKLSVAMQLIGKCRFY